MVSKNAQVILVLLVVQLLAVAYTFPVTEVFTNTPLLYIDNPAHWYRIVASTNALSDGNLDVYDPFFQAGDLVGLTHGNPAAKVPALLSAVTSPWLNAAQVWKSYTFIASAFAPLCIVFACYLWGLDWRSTALAGAMALLLWWASFFHWLHTAGLVSFVFASFLGVPYFAAVTRYLTQAQFSPARVFALGALGALGLLIHPLFGVPVAIATAVFIILCWNRLSAFSLIGGLLVIPGLSVISNWFWLGNVLDRVETKVSSTDTISVTHMSVVDSNLIWMELLGIWETPAMGSRLYLPVLLGATAAGLLARDERFRKLVWTLLGTGIFLVFYAALAASIPLFASLTQPNRFAPVGYLFMIPAAGYGVTMLWRNAAHYRGPIVGKVSAGTLLVTTIFLLWGTNEWRRELSYKPHGHYGAHPPQVKALGDYSKSILNWLQTQTDPSQRVLFEVANGRVHDNGHLAGYYAYRSKREFIGGPYPFVGPLNFWDGNLVGRPISAWSKEELSQFFGVYNIGWAVTHSKAATAALREAPAVQHVASFKELEFFRINAGSTATYFYEGIGRVSKIDHNNLRLEGLDGNRVILKYHYFDGLRTDPPIEITPVEVTGAVRPFIALNDPPEKLRLYLAE